MKAISETWVDLASEHIQYVGFELLSTQGGQSRILCPRWKTLNLLLIWSSDERVLNVAHYTFSGLSGNLSAET